MSKLRDVYARLDEIKLRAGKATKGPWLPLAPDGDHTFEWSVVSDAQPKGQQVVATIRCGIGKDAENALAVSASRQDVPDLVEAVEAQRELLGRIMDKAGVQAHTIECCRLEDPSARHPDCQGCQANEALGR